MLLTALADGHVPSSMLAELTGIPRHRVMTLLPAMAAKGLLTKTGQRRGLRYAVAR